MLIHILNENVSKQKVSYIYPLIKINKLLKTLLIESNYFLMLLFLMLLFFKDNNNVFSVLQFGDVLSFLKR